MEKKKETVASTTTRSKKNGDGDRSSVLDKIREVMDEAGVSHFLRAVLLLERAAEALIEEYYQEKGTTEGVIEAWDEMAALVSRTLHQTLDEIKEDDKRRN